MARAHHPIPNPAEREGTAQTWSLPPLYWGLLALLVGAKLFIHVLTSGSYGYFRDELYFLDCGRHLDFGYVDDAPMIALVSRLALMLGGSLYVVRILAALAGAAKVALTMGIARELGGRRFAQGLAGLCVLAAPIFLGIDSILNVSGFEPLFWMGCVFVLIRIIRTGNSRLWPWFGLIAGLGLENKYSMLVFGLALLIGLLLTPLRKELLKPWIWLAAGIALLLFLPTLLWQVNHGFPLIEDQENIRRMGKNVVLGPWAFVKEQIAFLHPLMFPIWLTGFLSLLLTRGSRLRSLAWLYAALLTLMILLHAKNYYLAAIYPMLFAAGAVAIEGWLGRQSWSRSRVWPQAAMSTVIALSMLMLIPALLPVLPPEKLHAYQDFLHMTPTKTEVHHSGPLDQRLGDQFGWDQLAAETAQIFSALSPEERAHTAIFASNYGEAGAINQFGPALGLPTAICAHQAHSLWGTPTFEGDTFICLGSDREGLEKAFRSVEQVADHHHPWGMAEENGPIFIGRGLKVPLKQMWPKLKHWD